VFGGIGRVFFMIYLMDCSRNYEFDLPWSGWPCFHQDLCLFSKRYAEYEAWERECGGAPTLDFLPRQPVQAEANQPDLVDLWLIGSPCSASVFRV